MSIKKNLPNSCPCGSCDCSQNRHDTTNEGVQLPLVQSVPPVQEGDRIGQSGVRSAEDSPPVQMIRVLGDTYSLGDLIPVLIWVGTVDTTPRTMMFLDGSVYAIPFQPNHIRAQCVTFTYDDGRWTWERHGGDFSRRSVVEFNTFWEALNDA